MHHLRMRKIFRRQTNHDGKSHRVYPPKIIQTSLLGRLHKKSYEHNDYVYVVYVQNGESGNPQRTIYLVHKITFKQITEVLHNTDTICLNIILRSWDMFLHDVLTELHIFFMTRSTRFFSSTAFVICRLLFF